MGCLRRMSLRARNATLVILIVVVQYLLTLAYRSAFTRYKVVTIYCLGSLLRAKKSLLRVYLAPPTSSRPSKKLKKDRGLV